MNELDNLGLGLEAEARLESMLTDPDRFGFLEQPDCGRTISPVSFSGSVNLHTHIDRWGRVCDCAHRDYVDSSLGVTCEILFSNST